MKKLIFFTLIFVFSFSSAFAEEKNTMTPGNVPTNVSADLMDYYAEKNQVIFTGNVYVKREEFELWADVITVSLKSNGEAQENSPAQLANLQSGEIEKIVAEKNVRMKYNTQTGTCGKATYTADQALLVMEIDPILKDGVNSISGEVIRYYMNENRSEVLGGKKRVEAMFSTSQPDTLKKTLNN